MSSPHTADILAAAIAVSIVKARRADEHQTPTTPEARHTIITEHSRRTLAELGLTRDHQPPNRKIEAQVGIRGGWTNSAQPIPLTYAMQCLQCETTNIQTHITVTDRRKAIKTHGIETGHTVISRWEQPSIM